MPEIVMMRGWFSHRYFFEKELHEKKILISDEEMSGGLFRGTYYEDYFVNLQKIKKLYGDPRIVFGIRNQGSFLLSVYKQHLHNGGSKKLEYLYNLEDTGLIKHHELLLLEKIEKLKELFSDVFIYSQERLKEDPQAFIDYFLKFTGCKERLLMEDIKIDKQESNVGVKSKFQVETLRKVNVFNDWIKKTKFIPHLYSRPFRMLKITPRMFIQHYFKSYRSNPKYEFSREMQEHLHSYYKEDWEKASKHVSF